MNNPFNSLEDDEAERLAILAEECAEVIQIVGKILRHGYESTHPGDEDGPTNRDMLEKELGHILAIERLMAVEDIELYSIRRSARAKMKSVKAYLHHQPQPPTTHE